MGEEYQQEMFRSQMVKKLEAAIAEQGGNFRHDPRNLENQAFARAKSRDEYLQYLSKMIMMIRNGSRPQAQAVTPQGQQPQPRQQMMGQQQQQMGAQQGQVNEMDEFNHSFRSLLMIRRNHFLILHSYYKS